jgi:hypothetical protein
MYLAGIEGLMQRKIPEAVGCPEVEISKLSAYQDNLKKLNDDTNEMPTGLMGCFCKADTNILLPWTLVGHNFKEFSDYNLWIPSGATEDKKNYCL